MAVRDAHRKLDRAAPDALELEIFRYAVESVVDELDVNVTRTAHSPLVYEYKDYAVGLLTRDFRLLSQSKYNVPVFLSSLGEPVRDAVEVLGGEEHLESGDIFITNYAPASGSHLNNVITATPVFDEGRIVGYVAIRTHWPDVGGLVPGSISMDARSLFHEGVQYRGLKLATAGTLDPAVLATIQANSWSPRLVTGDVMSNIAACTLGVARWREQVSRRWSYSEFEELVEAQFAASAALARRKVEELPDGDFRASVEMDHSGTAGSPPLVLTVRVVIDGDRLTVDMSDLPSQVAAPINSGIHGGAVTAARVAFKSLLVPDRPADDGLFEPLEIVIPSGTVLSRTGDAPMGFWFELVMNMVDLILRAIGEGAPDLVPAGSYGAQQMAHLTGQTEDGEWWQVMTSGQGGHGAHSRGDGFGPLMTLGHGDNPRIADEIIEARAPVRVIRRSLRRGAAGRGLHRGGPGTEEMVEVLADMFLGTIVNRTRTPAWGLAGGEPGGRAEIHLLEPGAKRWKGVGVLSHKPIKAGTRIRIRTGGGGGWGRVPGAVND